MQNFAMLKPKWNLILTPIILLCFPPTFSASCTLVMWVWCAFVTCEREDYPEDDMNIFYRAFFLALFTFAGFIMSLLLMWRIKGITGMEINLFQETIGWVYLIAIELSIFKIISLRYPRNRIRIGVLMGVINSLLLISWISPYGWGAIILATATLLFVCPLILYWIDRIGQ